MNNTIIKSIVIQYGRGAKVGILCQVIINILTGIFSYNNILCERQCRHLLFWNGLRIQWMPGGRSLQTLNDRIIPMTNY